MTAFSLKLFHSIFPHLTVLLMFIFKILTRKLFLTFILTPIFLLTGVGTSAQQIKVGVFRSNATPPLGTPVAYAPARSIQDSLSARGVVILSDEKPIVFCTLDWLGVANEGQDIWKKHLARAAKTTEDRVFIHALHQHDGMRCDFTSEKIMKQYGLGGTRYDIPVLMDIIRQTAREVRAAARHAQPVTHFGFGKTKVEKVASNRRILGEDGKVAIIRWSKSTDSAAIAAPEGLIDPWLKCVSFWNNDQPLAVMTWYATHPQSYYGEGDITSEFVGLARRAREETTRIPHIHFNGAGGNVAAGKYNDGSKEMRPVLASRMEAGMKGAWENTKKIPVSAESLGWRTSPVVLPLGKHLIPERLTEVLADPDAHPNAKLTAAKHLAWHNRTREGHKVVVSALRIGDIWLLNLPGELFIEYQLAAQKMRPGDEVCTAAYGEYGMGYIGTKIAYSQGGYETSERASRVAPEVEEVLMNAIREVLK